MSQFDWVGGPQPKPPPFRDIRNTRPTVAEEKAILAKQLGELSRKAPPNCLDWSVQRTREFRDACDKARKVAGAQRSSVHELRSALNSLEKYWK